MDAVALIAPRDRSQTQSNRRRWSVLLLWVSILLVAGIAWNQGLKLRRYAWDQTEPMRYVADINNAVVQGNDTLKIGYVERYDEQLTRAHHEGQMDLDYGPGRLAVATLWANWLDKVAPLSEAEKREAFFRVPWKPPAGFYARARNLHREYELCRPMMMVNLTGEILSSVALFFLVRRYTGGLAPYYRPMRGAVLGLIAALFFWFNPALIWNAHCWPQWDSWVLPFFLWAVLLASLDWWFCAGTLIITGAMFKGQILFGAPLFLLWPSFQGRIGAVLRWITGMTTAVAVITAVWLVRVPGSLSKTGVYVPGHVNPLAIQWLIYSALLFAAMVPILLLPGQRRARIPVAVLVAAVIAWTTGWTTGWTTANTLNLTFAILIFAVLCAAAIWLDLQSGRWKWRAKVPIEWIAIAVALYPLYVLARDWMVVELLGLICLGVLISMRPRQTLAFAASAWLAAAMLLCIPIFKASTGWFDLGIAFGTHHHEDMTNGKNENLAELLKIDWGWDDLMEPVTKIPKGKFADEVAHFLTNVDPGVRPDRVEGIDGPIKPVSRVPEKTPARSNQSQRNRPGVSPIPAVVKPGFVTLEPGEVGVPLKYFLLVGWVLSVIVCAVGTAAHDRNRSPRFLISIAAPWITLFAVMTQMHQRYLLWGASISAATAALNPGFAVLHLFLSFVAMSQEMQTMMFNRFDFTGGHFTDTAIYHFIDRWHPGAAWAVLLTACIFVYASVKLDRPSPSVGVKKEREALDA